MYLTMCLISCIFMCYRLMLLKVALEAMFNTEVKIVSKNKLYNCINNCSVYRTEKDTLLFVKDNFHRDSQFIFDGELESLKTIRCTNTVLAPRPIAVGRTRIDRYFLVVEYFNMTGLDNTTSANLGTQLAKMHMFNIVHKGRKASLVVRFGYHMITGCGSIKYNNSWTNDWITFFTVNRLGYQIDLLQKNPDDSPEKQEFLKICWPRLKPLIPKFFKGIEVRPSLLHGDLWFGNVDQIDNTPVIFDPASFYGHHEYDIASAALLNGFSDSFFTEYFKKIPKAPGFDNRIKLYQLFYHLNNWNQFGTKHAALQVITDLLKIYS